MEPDSVELLTRIAFAAVAGAIVGMERELRGHPAGLRTHALVATGAALFTVAGMVDWGSNAGAVDPSRIAAQVVTGLGFIGAGAILRDGGGVRGLTTASTIWMSGALGVASATGNFQLAGGALGLVLTVVVLLRGARELMGKSAFSTTTIEIRYLAGAETLERTLGALAAIPLHIDQINVSETDRGSSDRRAHVVVSGRREELDHVSVLVSQFGERKDVVSVELIRGRD